MYTSVNICNSEGHPLKLCLFDYQDIKAQKIHYIIFSNSESLACATFNGRRIWGRSLIVLNLFFSLSKRTFVPQDQVEEVLAAVFSC